MRKVSSNPKTIRNALAAALITLFIIPPTAHAGWIRTYGVHKTDYGNWVEQAGDGGYIMVGADYDPANFMQSMLLVRTDSSGATLWTRLYNGEPASQFAGGRCILTTAGGGYVAAGNSENLPWLVRLDPDGDTAWTRPYLFLNEMCDLYCVRETVDGYVMVGTKGQYLLIMTVDSAGDTLSVRSYKPEGTGSMTMTGYSVQPVQDAGFIVTGAGPDYGLWVLGTDFRGDTLWTKLYKLGDPYGYDEGHSIEPTSDGNWIITGAVDYDFFGGKGAVALMKISPDGDSLWARVYDYGPKMDYGNSVKEMADGGFVVAGVKNYSMQGTGSVWLLKTDSEGDTLWTRTYGKGGSYRDRGDCVQLTSDGGFIISGLSESYSPDNSVKAVLIKVDSLGGLGISETPSPVTHQPVTHQPVKNQPVTNLEILSSFGSEVILRYSLSPSERGGLKLFDASGRMVKSLPVCGEGEARVSALPAGVYFVRLQTGHSTLTRKAVIFR